MSADNYIHVKEIKQGEYLVRHMDASSGDIIETIGTFPNLSDAMKAANKFEQEAEYGVEYGIRFSPLKV